MKKIITLLCLAGMLPNAFAKMHSYSYCTNYTQNTTVGGQDILNLYVTADIGIQ